MSRTSRACSTLSIIVLRSPTITPSRVGSKYQFVGNLVDKSMISTGLHRETLTQLLVFRCSKPWPGNACPGAARPDPARLF